MRFDSFDEEQYKTTNPRVVEYLSLKEKFERMGRSLGSGDLADDVKALIEELEIADPETGSEIGPICEAI